ncbi:hypothetical protein EHQ12_04750 [Leptospira gomenensis]|uniref:Uncharacterized protein n=1 Tax=Leptospira gomenensis TaxID=2484974 RepID=A0A5F1YFW9_9LEPT|nr:hypothetical protein [Leptospira gomenensis]TGK38440.1 hypothetical protein EHQ17_02015 [Leptospira gomenensis]TGK42555.1 hypothetical protein EHQ07_14110 [Leptospira gomenensis]TGK42812.1 hypothetical protein EHQ12_04750 [Leptospira gomenensis]TGK55803.1 hypothetical protein EHQ13_16130 [Leptospira gomenensis]
MDLSHLLLSLRVNLAVFRSIFFLIILVIFSTCNFDSNRFDDRKPSVLSGACSGPGCGSDGTKSILDSFVSVLGFKVGESNLAIGDADPKACNQREDFFHTEQPLLYTFLSSGFGEIDFFVQGITALCIADVPDSGSTEYVLTSQELPAFPGAGPNIMIQRVNRFGHLVKSRLISGVGTQTVIAIERDVTGDGGFIIAGTSDADIPEIDGISPILRYAGGVDGIVVKLNRNFDVQWYTFLGGSGNENLRGLMQTSWYGYILVGDGNSDVTLGDIKPVQLHSDPIQTTNTDGWVVSLKFDGTVGWHTFLGGAYPDTFYTVSREFNSTSNKFIVAGIAGGEIPKIGEIYTKVKHSPGVNDDAFFAQLDWGGNLIWFSQFGSTGQERIFASAMGSGSELNAPDQTYLVGELAQGSLPFGNSSLPPGPGSTESLACSDLTGSEALIMAVNNHDGDPMWYTCVGTPRKLDRATSVVSNRFGTSFMVAALMQENVPELVKDQWTTLLPAVQHSNVNTNTNGQFYCDTFIGNFNLYGRVEMYTFFGSPYGCDWPIGNDAIADHFGSVALGAVGAGPLYSYGPVSTPPVQQYAFPYRRNLLINLDSKVLKPCTKEPINPECISIF